MPAERTILMQRKNSKFKVILSEARFKEEFLELETWFKRDTEWVFRGHASAEWKLANTLERRYKASINECYKKSNKITLSGYQKSDDFIMKKLEEKEKFLLTLFKKNIGECSEQDPALVKYISLMQHYGIPSRLLDFSRSINIALFFALENQGKDGGTDRAVVAVNARSIKAWVEPYKDEMRKKGCSESEIELKLADVLIRQANSKTSLKHRWYPIFMEGNSPRMIAQKGLFMMPLRLGNMDRDLCETLGGDYNNYETKRMSFNEFRGLISENKEAPMVISIEFPNLCFNKAKSILAEKGILYEKLFPELPFSSLLRQIATDE